MTKLLSISNSSPSSSPRCQFKSKVPVYDTIPLSRFLVLKDFYSLIYNSSIVSPMYPILSSSFHSSIFPFSFSLTSQIAISLSSPLFTGFIFFHFFYFFSSLCQYLLSYFLLDQLNNILVAYQLGNPSFQ